jgi:hypothetical protein
LKRYFEVPTAAACPEAIIELVDTGIVGAAIGMTDGAGVAADAADVEALAVSCVREATATRDASVLGALVVGAALEALT